MSHVDDGTLHAYLDGALDSLGSVEAARVREHLASCEHCARRLEEEGAWRDQAAAVLAGAVPEGEDLPPFEEIRARAAMASSPPTGRSVRRLAWAASVVLALGTGWMLRGASTRGGVGLRPSAPVVEPLSEEPAGLPASPARIATEEESSVDEAVGATRAAREERALADARDPGQVASGASGEIPVEGRRADFEPAEAQMAQALPDATEAKAADSSAAVLEADAGRAAGLAAEAAPARAEDSSVVLDAEVRGRMFPAPEELAPLGLRSQMARRGAAATTSAAAAASPGGELAEADAVRPVSFSGEAVPLAVPGLEVISVSRLEGAVMAGSVRVLQRLEGGDTLELIHLPPGRNPADDPRVAPVADDGRTELVVPKGLGWLVARARLPRGDLERIVRTLAPVGR